MTYETLILAEPTMDRETIDALLAKISGQREKVGGDLKNIDEWGVRKLAYQVGKHNEGLYVLYEFDGVGSDVVRPLEDFLRLQAPVMRFKTTRKLPRNGVEQSDVFSRDNDRDRDRR